MKKILAMFIALTLLLGITACSTGASTAAVSNVSTDSTSSVAVASMVSDTSASADSAVAVATEESSSEAPEDITTIVLGDTITVDGTGAEVNGNVVTINAGGHYRISGVMTNGYVDVNTTEKVHLWLNGVSITNSSGPALMVTNAQRITVILEAGTTNTFIDAANNNENDAAIFTNDTFVIEGDGALVVQGNNVEGISSDDDIIINSGTISVTAVDDGLNAHDDITINGGILYVIAGGDGIDSNGTVHITGGVIFSDGSNMGGDGGVDAMGEFIITGGTLFAAGNTINAPSTNSTQYSIYVSTGQTLQAGTIFRVELNGAEIFTFAPDAAYQNVLFSSPSLTDGTTYQVYVGGSYSTASVNGVYSGGTYDSSSAQASLTAVAALSPAGAGMFGGGGPGGGQPGGRPGGGQHP